MGDQLKHTRVNDILLGPLERPALQYFCKIMPAWATPDTMTLIGILGAVITAAGYMLTHVHIAFIWLASFGFLVNWYGDSMDGTLARYRKIERPKYGYYVDHIVDVIDEFLIIMAMGLSPLAYFEIASVALIGYFMLSVHTFLRTYVDNVFKISYSKLGPTEVRALIVLANTLVFFTGNPVVFTVSGFALTIFDLFISIIALLLFYFFAVSVVPFTIHLARKGE